MFPLLCFGQIDVPIQNTSTDDNVKYRLFATKNIYTFLGLNTSDGRIWQVHSSTSNLGKSLHDEDIINQQKEIEIMKNHPEVKKI